ncbi:hypothetical protein SAMN05216358_0062 [Rhizobium sp. AN5]|uniref:hypothetical protein n=1 Tax=Rhizobium sp. AN5 TaxID=1855304 RepID=UPI000BC5F95B|nr:hypothetical protein [Rhizobium sp. AN5]SOC90043.1 hypothetical protein SAMN05216358_0062 [Rhizobium sp. AN5]
MNDHKAKVLKFVGYAVLAYAVLTTRVVEIHPTAEPASRYVIGTNFWAFYPFDSAAAYCERNVGSDRSLNPINCTSWVSDGVAAKWLTFTIYRGEPVSAAF